MTATPQADFKDRAEFEAALADAVRFERIDRAAAFLGINESIGEFEVKPMTLRHYTALQLIGSPFLPPFETPTIHQIAEFLWLLSPEYSPTNTKGRSKLLKRLRAYVLPEKPWLKFQLAKWEDETIRRTIKQAILIGDEKEPATGSIRRFVLNTLSDRPASPATNDYTPDYYSDPCAICAALMREYSGLNEDACLDMPLKRIFQYLKEKKWFRSENPLLSNPSDRIKNKWLLQCNRKN